MKIIPSFETNAVRAVLASDFPEFEITNIKLINNGWDNLAAEINNEWIFRFPKSEDYNFDLELKILDVLKDKVRIQIPRVEFIGKSYTYMGYRKIPGGDMTKEIFNSLSATQKETFTTDLADFLYHVHSAISPEEARRLGAEEEDLPSYAEQARTLIGQKALEHHQDFILTTINEFETMIPEKTEYVFLYNDLHTENMAFDPLAKKLNGIFDFGDGMIGDVHMDFNPLYKFNPDLMRATVEKYEEISGRRLNLRRMVIYGRMAELCDLALFVDQPKSSVYQNATERMGHWGKDIDLFTKKEN